MFPFLLELSETEVVLQITDSIASLWLNFQLLKNLCSLQSHASTHECTALNNSCSETSWRSNCMAHAKFCYPICSAPTSEGWNSCIVHTLKNDASNLPRRRIVQRNIHVEVGLSLGGGDCPWERRTVYEVIFIRVQIKKGLCRMIQLYLNNRVCYLKQ